MNDGDSMNKNQIRKQKFFAIFVGIFLFLSLAFGVFFGFAHFMSNREIYSIQEEKKKNSKEEKISNGDDDVTQNLSSSEVSDESDQIKKTFDKMTVKVDDAGSIEIKRRMDYFISVATYYSVSRSNYLLTFMEGKSSIDSNDKMKITYQSLVYVQQKHKKVFIVPEKYKGTKEWSGVSEHYSDVYELSIEDFKNEYKNLFHEELNNFDGLDCGFPFISNVDMELGKIYLLGRCGGYGNVHKFSKNVHYYSDSDYYYVEQKVALYYSRGELKSKTIVWKFDKNGYYINNTVFN